MQPLNAALPLSFNRNEIVLIVGLVDEKAFAVIVFSRMCHTFENLQMGMWQKGARLLDLPLFCCVKIPDWLLKMPDIHWFLIARVVIALPIYDTLRVILARSRKQEYVAILLLSLKKNINREKKKFVHGDCGMLNCARD